VSRYIYISEEYYGSEGVFVFESIFGHCPLRSEFDGKNIIEDMVKVKSNPIQSVYIPTYNLLEYSSNLEGKKAKKNSNTLEV
jgi:hypothetical protein